MAHCWQAYAHSTSWAPSCLSADHCDYVYAGVVAEPTISELAVIVQNINRGARERKEGKIIQKANTEDVGMGLEFVYELMKEILSPQEQADIGLDMIVVEHTLCKFSRALNRKYIVL
ncbi:hypothetical protein Hypma_016200 [Hypsizygus marmoreus]|uniref:Uncharacterized protein n=1 Tax=Hypsizygus marmoreus TaxID=39966 RepID=A0A369J5J4_HYPMA|nr:hypothetical protein Hypma_016200 [Hypsizygus marmoreus]